MKKLPKGLLSRTLATTRIVGRLGVSGARRVLGSSEAEDVALGEALFAELDRMKGMAMKVGQILSYLDVGLPEETQRRLAKLQEGAEPFLFEAIRAAIETDLGAPIETLFDHIDPVPVAAASVGQVHRARLEGTEVAVKVRYPGVEDTIASDFARLESLGRIASLAAAVDGAAIVAELKTRMVAETDYRLEAENQRRFRTIAADIEDVEVPEVVDTRCADGVLTTRWHEGDGFTTLRTADSERRTRSALALTRFPYRSLFGHGRLQADPHPGNFRFHADGSVTALDFGCVRAFTAEQVDAFRVLSSVVVRGERDRYRDAVVRCGLAPRVERLDFDLLWDMHRWQYAPYITPTFRFERRWWEAGLHFTRPSNRNARHQGFPPHWLWLQRTQFGLHSVLLQLDVELALRDPFLDWLEA